MARVPRGQEKSHVPVCRPGEGTTPLLCLCSSQALSWLLGPLALGRAVRFTASAGSNAGLAEKGRPGRGQRRLVWTSWRARR